LHEVFLKRLGKQNQAIADIHDDCNGNFEVLVENYAQNVKAAV
jgi:hypothetical protein